MKESTIGCIIQLIIILLVAWLGDFLMGYNLEVWLGYDQWGEVNVLLRLLIGLLAIEATIPLAIIGFIAGLVVGVPIFPV